MKKLMLIAAILILVSCEKITFKEYYECEKTYKATVKELDSLYKAKLIKQTDYLHRLETAAKDYDNCLANAEGK